MSPGLPCRRCGSGGHRFEGLSTSYVYLLGLYLGDGCISRGARDVFRLRIALDRKYPINTGSGGWRAPRYSFSNLSTDIKRIFCEACDQLDLHWTTAPPSPSTSRARRMWRGWTSSSGPSAEAQAACSTRARRPARAALSVISSRKIGQRAWGRSWPMPSTMRRRALGMARAVARPPLGRTSTSRVP